MRTCRHRQIPPFPPSPPPTWEKHPLLFPLSPPSPPHWPKVGRFAQARVNRSCTSPAFPSFFSPRLVRRSSFHSENTASIFQHKSLAAILPPVASEQSYLFLPLLSDLTKGGRICGLPSFFRRAAFLRKAILLSIPDYPPPLSLPPSPPFFFSPFDIEEILFFPLGEILRQDSESNF